MSKPSAVRHNPQAPRELPIGAQRLSLDAAWREAKRMRQRRWRRAAGRLGDGVVGIAALAVIVTLALAAIGTVVFMVASADVPRWEIGLVIWLLVLGAAGAAMKAR